MKVGDITDAVLATGYRSNSDNFRAIVNQTLIKERKRFLPIRTTRHVSVEEVGRVRGNPNDE